ncbi:MAG: tagaturonate reductase [Bacteroidetes bacterium]|nr:tagaturonate reductase [Bacteroidota bacterium]
MILSRQNIHKIESKTVQLPRDNYFDLPEKVLQFGTGVLLRGLTDFFIDKANKQGIFNGRIVVVKSTDTGDASGFDKQDNLYTICVKGLVEGKKFEEYIVNASVSRVLSAKNNWKEILACATNPDIELIISNTTEVGIMLVKENIRNSPPASFPAKLLAVLYERYKFFKGDKDKGVVIIPTELLPDNGNRLLAIILELATHNGLEDSFINWLKENNCFCNSLVDRIVPGKLSLVQQQDTENFLGYEDELMIMSEVYRLWAIEPDSEKVKRVLSFSKADEGVIIAPDIHLYRELKLRLLNGSHTLSCGLAHLAGFTLVRDAMQDETFYSYVRALMIEEITPSIISKDLTTEIAIDFANKILDRYRNPFIEHKWLSITLQYSSKMRMRDVPILLNYFERFEKVPSLIALGFAAHILFMKSEKNDDGNYYETVDGKKYLIQDTNVAYYAEKWKQPQTVVKTILSNVELWGTDLSSLTGFADAVIENLSLLEEKGVIAVIKEMTKELAG